MKVPYTSAQIVELAAIHLALVTFPTEPINFFTDKMYIGHLWAHSGLPGPFSEGNAQLIK